MDSGDRRRDSSQRFPFPSWLRTPLSSSPDGVGPALARELTDERPDRVMSAQGAGELLAQVSGLFDRRTTSWPRSWVFS
jgi:hypothetical protein